MDEKDIKNLETKIENLIQGEESRSISQALNRFKESNYFSGFRTKDLTDLPIVNLFRRYTDGEGWKSIKTNEGGRHDYFLHRNGENFIYHLIPK